MPPFETMLLSDLFKLAGARNAAQPGEMVRVRYIPTTQGEADDLLRIGLTLFLDITVKPPVQVWCAGFTDAELMAGNPGVRIGRD
jgi:hypothetical protein